MQAIRTTRIPATETKPTRIKAATSRGSVTITEDDSSEAAHVRAADALVARFIAQDHDAGVWGRPRAVGQLPDGSFAHVFLPR